MLNEERKNEFLDEYYPDSKDNLRHVLIRMFNMEDAIGKDLCECNKSELLDVYKNMELSVGTLYYHNNLFTKYVDWCINKGYWDGENIGKSIGLNDLSRTSKERSILTLDELTYIANTYENPIDKVLILAPFYGFSSKDGYVDYTIEKDCIDEQNGVVALPERDITVPTSFCELLLECFDTYTYKMDKATHTMSGRGLIKVKGNAENEIDITNIIQSKYSRRFKKDFPDISYLKTVDSGIVYYSKKYAIENKILSSEQLWRDTDYIDTVFGRFNKKKINKRTFYDRYAVLIFSIEP